MINFELHLRRYRALLRNLREVRAPLEKVRMEENLAEGMLGLAVESCPSGMVMSDADGRILMVNGEIERLFGYSRGELLGQAVETLVPKRLRSQHVEHRETFAAAPDIRRMGSGRDLSGLRKDGTEFPVEIGLTSLGSGDGRVVLCVIVDSSERKRLERLKDEFVSTVSHELRTPLTSISGSLGLLVGQRGGKLPDSAARLVEIAHKNSQRLVRLINDILDIEKIESGRLIFNLSQVHMRPLIAQAIEANRGFADGYGVHVELDSTSVDCEVNADPDRLTQVVTNLLSNAIKFSSANGDVTVKFEPHGDVVRMTVRDHGSGIPAEFKPHIFEKFAQADPSSLRPKEGTGLGLSIVKQIVERLGGEVGFADAPGGGTVFDVTLPAWDAVAERDVDPEGQPGAPRILLCEDDRDTAFVMRARLRQAGFAADFAYTAADAIARAATTGYAAIMVDLQLPDGDGIDVILRLRAQTQYHETPIIVVSGDPNRGVGDERSSRLNVLGWLKKPVDLDHLVGVLKTSIPPTSVRAYKPAKVC